jgi:hypothetical protein
VETSLDRELAFVLSHTIHHNALIGVMAKLLGGAAAGRIRIRPVHRRAPEGEGMCTLTIISRPDGGFRLAFNRDESRSRAAALPPERRRFGDRSAILPIDPPSDGTWIAVNDAGLVLALLNANPVPRPERRGTRSRGMLIPDLLPSASLDDVVTRMAKLTAGEFPPFRLVAIAESRIADWKSNGFRITQTGPGPIVAPLMFTSSGLGDELVEGPRRGLFETMFFDGSDRRARQDKFHRHTWPDQPHLSVCMSRADARTVSLTVAEWDEHNAWMTYTPDAPDIADVAAMARILFETPVRS